MCVYMLYSVHYLLSCLKEVSGRVVTHTCIVCSITLQICVYLSCVMVEVNWLNGWDTPR